MPKFLITKGHDAWALYETLVEASSAAEAESIAMDRNYEGEWHEMGVEGFDHFELMEDQTEEVDDDFTFETISSLPDRFGDEHPGWTVEDWKLEVDNDDTRLGYWEWVAARLEEDNET